MSSVELSQLIYEFPAGRFISLKFKPTLKSILISALLLGVSGCDSTVQQDDSINRPSSPVVAYVNEEAITQADVDFMLQRMLKGQAFAQVDDALREKILDSLISSRAMKIQMESLLTPEEMEEIDRSANAYKEELYVKEYLAKHVVPEPVTMEMVQAHYDKHPEEFGGELVRDFQILVLSNAQDQQARDKFLAAIPEIKATKDWSAAKDQLAQAYMIKYQEGRARPGLLDPVLEQAISRLSEAEISDLVYVNDQIYLIKIVGVKQLAPKPLVEVSAEIRKKLAAQQLRAAVKKASEDVLTKVEVKSPSSATR